MSTVIPACRSKDLPPRSSCGGDQPELIGKAEAMDSPQRVVLDVDSTEIPVCGQQEDSAYNGSFRVRLLSPAAAVQLLAAELRPGNVHSAERWEELLLPEIERQHKQGKEVVVLADTAFGRDCPERC